MVRNLSPSWAASMTLSARAANLGSPVAETKNRLNRLSIALSHRTWIRSGTDPDSIGLQGADTMMGGPVPGTPDGGGTVGSGCANPDSGAERRKASGKTAHHFDSARRIPASLRLPRDAREVGDPLFRRFDHLAQRYFPPRALRFAPPVPGLRSRGVPRELLDAPEHLPKDQWRQVATIGGVKPRGPPSEGATSGLSM